MLFGLLKTPEEEYTVDFNEVLRDQLGKNNKVICRHSQREIKLPKCHACNSVFLPFEFQGVGFCANCITHPKIWLHLLYGFATAALSEQEHISVISLRGKPLAIPVYYDKWIFEEYSGLNVTRSLVIPKVGKINVNPKSISMMVTPKDVPRLHQEFQKKLHRAVVTEHGIMPRCFVCADSLHEYIIGGHPICEECYTDLNILNEINESIIAGCKHKIALLACKDRERLVPIIYHDWTYLHNDLHKSKTYKVEDAFQGEMFIDTGEIIAVIRPDDLYYKRFDVEPRASKKVYQIHDYEDEYQDKEEPTKPDPDASTSASG